MKNLISNINPVKSILRWLLKIKLHKESLIVRESSLKVLRELEELAD